jgi:adenylate kinase
MKCRTGISSMQVMVAVLAITVGFFGWYWYSHRSVEQQVPTSGTPSKMIVALLGAPGSGKGTLAERAAKELGFVVLSTGNVVRENIAKDTDLGKQVKEFSAAGKLVPDEIIFGMVKEWLAAQTSEGKEIILDGFPRTATQAAMLADLLKSDLHGYTLRLIDIDVPDEEVINRIANRLTCENKACQSTYQKSQFEDPENALCPRCGGKLIKRADDSEAVVKERLAVYAQANSPLIAYYRTAGVPREAISGAGKTPDEVFMAFKALVAK